MYNKLCNAFVFIAAAALVLPARAQQAPSNLPVCPLIATGGTIAMKIDPVKHAPVPAISGEDLLATVPEVADHARVEVKNVSNVPILGLQLIEKSDEQATFRSDFRDHTLVYEVGDPSQQSVGLEVRTQAVLDRAVAALAANGITATTANADALVRRKARAMASFRDRSGNTFELVVRPETSGWRYFPSRDAGITGLAAAALRTTSDGADETMWTSLFNGRVSDWVGDAAFIRFDDAHHRLALHPSSRVGVLAIEYAVEGLNQIMQAMYFLQSAQVKIVHGPGRRPTSDQIFLTFAGPEDMLFSYVAEGAP